MVIKNKKGVSPVIATVLLISIVIVIGLIIFLWFRGITEEAITKFGGKNVKLVCEDVKFEASYSSGYIYISNTGNVPIYKVKAKVYSSGSHSTIFISSDWPASGLTQGAAYSGPLEAGEKIILIPVLIGKAESGEKAYTCEERHGVEIIV
jgi:FlaG/FlaF family flagellin (archaellin)